MKLYEIRGCIEENDQVISWSLNQMHAAKLQSSDMRFWAVYEVGGACISRDFPNLYTAEVFLDGFLSGRGSMTDTQAESPMKTPQQVQLAALKIQPDFDIGDEVGVVYFVDDGRQVVRVSKGKVKEIQVRVDSKHIALAYVVGDHIGYFHARNLCRLDRLQEKVLEFLNPPAEKKD